MCEVTWTQVVSGQRNRCWGPLPTEGGWAVPTLGPAMCLLLRPATGTGVSCLPHPGPFWRWTGSSGGGRCVPRSSLLDRALVLGGVCSRVPSLDSDSVHEGVSVGTVPGLCVHLRRPRRTLPVSMGSQPTSHLLRQCPPTAPDMKTFLHPHAQPRPLHPTHSSPSTVFEGRRISLVSHPQHPAVPSWLSEALGVDG